MNKLSVVINVIQSEVDFLSRALESTKGLADEIVIVDMTRPSHDLAQIVKEFNAKTYTHKFVNYVEPVRNFGVAKATGDWVLILDPDEEISPTLAKAIKKAITGNYSYFRIPRKNLVFGKWLRHSRWWPDYNIRLFRKGSVSWNEVIHTVPMTEGKGFDMEVGEENAIIHHHYETIEQFVERMNRYTGVQAKFKIKDGYKFSWADIIIKPAGEFFSRYFAGEGYKDGLHGLAIALLQAVSELVLYLKIWQTGKFGEEEINLNDFAGESAKVASDLNYWVADALVKQKGSIVNRIKRKFRLR